MMSEAKLDYLVEIYNIGTPLQKSLGEEEYRSFFHLYQDKNSHFYRWVREHEKDLRKVSKEDKSKYFESLSALDLPTLVRKIFPMKTGTSVTEREKIELPFSTPLATQIGGQPDLVLDFFIAIAFYLFCREVIDARLLPKPVSKYEPEQMTGGYNVTDLSGDKAEYRIVLLVGTKDKQYVVKIVPDILDYHWEILIYSEMNKRMSSLGLAESIVQIYYRDRLTENLAGDYPIILEQEHIVISMQSLRPKLARLYFSSYYYFTLEYDASYPTLKTHVSAGMNTNDKLQLALNLQDLLRNLNDHYHFCHLDLHGENLLVKNVNNQIQFKLFDFDISYTKENPNLRLLSSVEPIIYYNSIDTTNSFNHDIFRRIGYWFDITRFMLSLKIDKKEKIKDSKFLSIVEINSKVNHLMNSCYLPMSKTSMDSFSVLQYVAISLYFDDTTGKLPLDDFLKSLNPVYGPYYYAIDASKYVAEPDIDNFLYDLLDALRITLYPTSNKVELMEMSQTSYLIKIDIPILHPIKVRGIIIHFKPFTSKAKFDINTGQYRYPTKVPKPTYAPIGSTTEPPEFIGGRHPRSTSDGGYHKKYLKYKAKYLRLQKLNI